MASGSVLGDMLARISETGRALLGADEPRPLVERAEALLGGEGEATGVARARAVIDSYTVLPIEERLNFLRAAAARFGPDRARLDPAIAAYRDAPSDVTARALHMAAEPRSQELFRRLNRAPGGTRALVRMREDMLSAARNDAELGALDEDFRHLFMSWFNRGFLTLRRIDWHTSASVLEKIIQYEAVHEIRDWSDLRRRVGAPDRQLYAFFHPALDDDPLIFVEVALTGEIPGAIGPILAEKREVLPPVQATTAVFYSISNCQRGLRGVSFGNFLIKQVVEELRADFPALTSFVTLSPVPGFTAWLNEDPERAAAPAEALAPLCACYLTEAKRRDGQPADPVARFHLGNGARLERVNADADLSSRGLAESRGVMVNYLYDLRDIEKNHEAYAATGTVAHSSAVRRLVRQASKMRERRPEAAAEEGTEG